ncbi:aminopeptidase Q [Latimeria chalumnae]|uniref:aminopeptidase Q n=1 Tax=Latimeria chalumnae TaxID=7897 RepID=UPI0003C13009|nr:PREDICTED: aminopeptidase Q [Latimeria chalumnae]|eukprot:XP_005992125.1 PREDICTED: aminopeptidase Q [Latimeria chalumnae]
MGPKSKSRSGFYLSKPAVLFFALLIIGLLMGFTILAALYARSRMEGAPQKEEEGPQKVAGTATPSPNISEPSRSGIWDKLRLPHSLFPLNYQLELWPRLEPDEEGIYRFTGQVNISFQCRQETNIILLHSFKLIYSSIDLDTLAGQGRLPGTVHSWTAEENPYLVIQLNDTLQEGSTYVLSLDFYGELEQSLIGLFITHYIDEGVNKTVIASQMEPTYARLVFPCFDEPALKATFDIRIVHPPGFVALSNMPAIGTAEREDKNGNMWKVTTFSTTLRMSTYITAFVVCDFDHVKSMEKGKEIRIWARKEAVKAGRVNYALSITGPILTFLEELFNVSYPLTKTDLVALPEFEAGGMENWGLMIFREESLLLDLSYTFNASKSLICAIIAHELGHQWFGNLVTMNWWNNLWLNEGFASYIEYLGANYIEPTFKMYEFFIFQVFRVFLSDSGAASRPLSMKEEDVEEEHHILDLFDEFSYHKGASIVRMAANFLTDKVFSKGISSFLRNFSFSNAEQDDLWHHLQMAVNCQNEVQLPASVKTILDSWTLQKGIPVITLNTSTGTVSQKRLMLDPKDNRTLSDNFTWFVPLFWMKNGSEQPVTWLQTHTKVFPEMKITSENEWILLNLESNGYYRVNYDTHNWDTTVLQLKRDPNTLPIVNRAKLIDDAFTLAYCDETTIEVAFNTTKYLAKERELVVWITALEHLNYFLRLLMDSLTQGLIKEYVLKRFAPFFEYYTKVTNWNLRDKTDLLEYYGAYHIRLETFIKTACWLGLKVCQVHASNLYSQWMKNPWNNTIPLYIRRTVYCYGISAGSYKEWEFAWKMFQNNTLNEKKDALLFGMSCSTEPWILERYLQYSLDSSLVKPEDTYFIIEYVSKNAIGRPLAWEFIRANWEQITMKTEGFMFKVTTVLETLAQKSTTDFQLQEVVSFINNTLEECGLKLTERIMEIKQTKMEWRSKYQTRIHNWLKDNIAD